MEPCRLDAVAARDLLRDGRLTVSALMRSCLGRIAEREPTIGAFAHLDAAEALRPASAADAAGRSGTLAGLPVGIKDICDTADMPTARGSRLFAGRRPAADATCVAALRHAGAVLPGKTTTTEFAGAEPTATRNPHDPTFSPGGSSAGSAAAVADFMLPLAIGTQTAGSIIRPAAFCGIVGLKPSFGRVPTAGVWTVAPSLDTIGTFGRTVADAALGLSVLAGDPALAVGAAQVFRPRIGVCRTAAWDGADAAVRASIEAAARLFASAGAPIQTIVLPAPFDRAIDDQNVLMGAETARSLYPAIEAGRDRLGPATVAAFEAGALVTAEAEARARENLVACGTIFDAALGECDVLITPSAAAEAPEGLGWTGDPLFNRLWTALGTPCLTLPFTRGPNKLPIGIQIVGRRGSDARLLAAALWLEAVIARSGTAAP